jgi:UrcA family protein
VNKPGAVRCTWIAGVAAGALGIAATSGVASAETTVVSATVHKGDLDLSTAAGARAMLQRIWTAADRLCDDDPNERLFFGTVQHSSDIRQCRAEALARAVANLGVTAVTAEYERMQAGQSGVVAAR